MLEIQIKPQNESPEEVAITTAKAANLAFQYESRLILSFYYNGKEISDFFDIKEKDYSFITVKYEDRFCLLVDFINELANLDLTIVPIESNAEGLQYRYEKRTGKNKPSFIECKKEKSFDFFTASIKGLFNKEDLISFKNELYKAYYIVTSNGYITTIDKL
jgi:hypothetical protein